MVYTTGYVRGEGGSGGMLARTRDLADPLRMANMAPLTPADESFFRDAPQRIVQQISLGAEPDLVFEALADASSWPKWFPLMNEAAWVSDQTSGVGAEREVNLRLLGRFRERMIAWEPGERYAFTIVSSTSGMASTIGEDYRIRSDGPGRSLLDWTFAAAPRSWVKPAAPIVKLAMTRLFAAAGPRLDRYLHAERR